MQRLAALRAHYNKIKSWYLRYERLLMPLTLVVGFIIDYLTFVHIQVKITLPLLLGYWLLAGVIIIFIHAYDEARLSQKFRYIRLFSPLALQFTFGALLGGSFIFYWTSGALTISWPFILFFLILMVSTDQLRKFLANPLAQIGIYSFVTLTFFALLFPYLFSSISPVWFVVATCTSLAALALLIQVITRLNARVRSQRAWMYTILLIIIAGLNTLYFLNFIPPIPLTVREAAAYHSVHRVDGEYKLLGESENIWQKFALAQTLHLTDSERTYVYSAIFAPEKLNTTIVHDWQYFDESLDKWISQDKIPFTLTGGRQSGFRGYSWKSAVRPGKWRVYIQTPRGQTLGRVRFDVIRVNEPVLLIEYIK